MLMLLTPYASIYYSYKYLFVCLFHWNESRGRRGYILEHMESSGTKIMKDPIVRQCQQTNEQRSLKRESHVFSLHASTIFFLHR